MRNPFARGLFFYLLFVVLAPQSLAAGLNSTPGGDLPLGAGGASPSVVVKNETGNVGVKSADPKAKLDVAGGLKLGEDNACNSAKGGTLTYRGGALYVCTAAGWQKLPVEP